MQMNNNLQPHPEQSNTAAEPSESESGDELWQEIKKGGEEALNDTLNGIVSE